MAMVGGTIAGLLFSKNDAGFTHNGALAGLIAICAGSDVVHPIAAGIFGRKALGGVADLNFLAQLSGSLIAVVYALTAGFIVYKLIDVFYGLRMSPQEELIGSDRTFHRIEANPEESL